MSQLNADLRNVWSEQYAGRRLPIEDPYSRAYAPTFERSSVGERLAEAYPANNSDLESSSSRRWVDFYLKQGFSKKESRILAYQICSSELGQRGALPLDDPSQRNIMSPKVRLGLAALIRRKF
jgi:hypothetical protein